MRFLFTTIILLLISQLQAQYISGFQQEYFYGNLPSAKTEAMGMADAAIGGTVASTFFNAAGLGGVNSQEIYLSNSAPFYVLRNSSYWYAGYARRIIPRVILAFSVNNFGTGETIFDVDFGDQFYPITKGLTSNYALSVAGTPVKGLYVGFNFNFFRWKLFTDVKAANAFLLDGGLLYKLNLPEMNNLRHHAQFGVGVNNFTFSKINYEAPDGNTATNDFPVIGRFAAAYFLGTDVTLPAAGTGPLDFTFTVEYQTNFNSDYFNTFSVGLESMIWKVLALRLGYFTQSLDDLGNDEVNRNKIHDFTYGFGAIIPLYKLTSDKIPLSIHLDYLSLKPPSMRKDQTLKVTTGRPPNMRTFNMRVVWTLKDIAMIGTKKSY